MQLEVLTVAVLRAQVTTMKAQVAAHQIFALPSMSIRASQLPVAVAETADGQADSVASAEV
jgi:hypothetical protein